MLFAEMDWGAFFGAIEKVIDSGARFVGAAGVIILAILTYLNNRKSAATLAKQDVKLETIHLDTVTAAAEIKKAVVEEVGKASGGVEMHGPRRPM